MDAAQGEASAAARQFADHLAIQDVVTRYGRAVDDADWEALASCFAPGAHLRFPTRTLEGPAAIVDFIQTATAHWRWQQHLLGSFDIRVNGDAAVSTCYLHATQVTQDEAEAPLVTMGTYRDRLARIDGQWRIVERWLEVGWAGPLYQPTHQDQE
jgi:ketosteroid isomerase-like protein